jgi:hypothetical protein
MMLAAVLQVAQACVTTVTNVLQEKNAPMEAHPATGADPCRMLHEKREIGQFQTDHDWLNKEQPAVCSS